MSISEAVGAGAALKIGDQEYIASPVELYDLGVIEEAVKAAIIHNAAIGGAGLPPSTRKELTDNAHLLALSISFYSPQVKAYLASFKGAAAMVVTSLRFKHPNIDTEAVMRVLAKNPDQMATAVDTVSRVSGFTADTSTGATPKGEAEAGA